MATLTSASCPPYSSTSPYISNAMQVDRRTDRRGENGWMAGRLGRLDGLSKPSRSVVRDTCPDTKRLRGDAMDGCMRE